MGRYGQVFVFLCYFFFLLPLHSSSELSQDQNNTMFIISGHLRSPLWNTTDQDPCHWKGVNCSASSPSQVTSLSFSGLGISSSPSFLTLLCSLKTLQSLDLSRNFLTSIPDTFFINCGRLTGLKSLNFSSNRLSGSLPYFSGFGTLESLDFSHNLLGGTVDNKLEGLAKFKNLNLSFNNFSGVVPVRLGNASALQILRLSNNLFHGDIHSELLNYKNLTVLDLSSNSLSGSVPEWVANFSKLEYLVLSTNKLAGEIPQSLSTIKTLSWFGANTNNFTGSIPPGITKYVKNLDLSYNSLVGLIPADLLSPQNLTSIDLTSNSLEGPVPQNISRSLYRLRLGQNSLNGSIPAAMGRISELIYLELDSNKLHGEIPLQLGDCSKLMLLNLAENYLQGSLPKELGNLPQLAVLKLQMNNITGEIPKEFSQLEKLLTLNLSSNSLEGMVPSWISNLRNLTNLNLESNQLKGQIPDTISQLGSLLELRLGNNKLTGLVPKMPHSLAIALNLSSNAFYGFIPTDLGNLQGLEVLDLSHNEFTGEIPKSFSSLESLTHLVLSYNQLSGTLPQFRQHVTIETTGNKDLVNASIIPPPAISPEKKRSVVLIIVISFVSAVVGSGIVVAILIFIFSRHFSRVEDGSLKSKENLPQVINARLITDNSIHRSSIDFVKAMEVVDSPVNVVHKTRFSAYYKTIMPGGMSYYVKKLDWSYKNFQLGSHEKLRQELEILGKLRNSNIMIPLAYILTTDSAYLLYEDVHVGTIFDFLHKGLGEALEWPARFYIALRVAQGLTFLHGCNQPVLLLDLSTKTILLKSVKDPQIGDIELCKVIDPSKSTGSLSTVAGSVGYIPPEYAYAMRVTTAGNVYSFGVVLLELLTGKPPVNEGTELAKWALSFSATLKERDQILDPSISETSLPVRSQMLAVLKIALRCVNDSPEARPNMRNVLRMLLNAR